MLHLSGTGLPSGWTGMGLSSVLSHREDSRAPQPSNLWRQPQELSLVWQQLSELWTAPGAWQSLCASNLQNRIWNSKSAKARSSIYQGRASYTAWGLVRFQRKRKIFEMRWGCRSATLSPELPVPGVWVCFSITWSPVKSAGALKYPDIFCEVSWAPFAMVDGSTDSAFEGLSHGRWWLSEVTFSLLLAQTVPPVSLFS